MIGMLQLVGIVTILTMILLYIVFIWKFLSDDSYIVCPVCGTKNPIEYFYASSCKATCSMCGKTLSAHLW